MFLRQNCLLYRWRKDTSKIYHIVPLNFFKGRDDKVKKLNEENNSPDETIPLSHFFKPFLY